VLGHDGNGGARMNPGKISKVFLILFLFQILTACNSSDEGAEFASGVTPSPNTETVTPPKEDGFPAGSMLLVSSHSRGTLSESVSAPDGTIISYKTNVYDVIMSLPEYGRNYVAGWTRNGAGASTYIWGFTQNSKLYTVRTTTSHDESDSKTLREIDVRTGMIKSSCSFTTHDAYGGFTLKGGDVYYFSGINRNLYGTITSGGKLKKKNCSTGSERTLTSFEKKGGDKLYFARDKLVTVSRKYVSSTSNDYSIRNIDKTYGYTRQNWFNFSATSAVFSSGSDGIYWAKIQARRFGGYLVRVYRLTPESVASGPELLFSVNATSTIVNLDVENEKVLLVVKNNGPRYHLYNLENQDLEDLDIDSELYSTLVNGNGEFMYLD